MISLLRRTAGNYSGPSLARAQSGPQTVIAVLADARHAPGMKALACIIGFTLVSLSATARDLPPATDRGEKTEAEVQLMGTLERRVAIGGETTGWVLRYDKDQRVDLLLPIDAFAWIRDGLVVTVKGRFETRQYPERGPVRVFVVREINEVVT